MHFFNITLNDCSELSGFMFTVKILFQRIWESIKMILGVINPLDPA